MRELRFDGLEQAAPAPAASRRCAGPELVVIGPSNPLLSIDPICALLAPHLERERVVAVSPIVGGRALKGPTVDADGPARRGADGARGGPPLRGAGRRISSSTTPTPDWSRRRHRPGDAAHVLDTVMAGAEGELRLAADLLGVAGA